MNGEQVRESIVVADCGRTMTRATLVEIVEGACRFVAQGTSPSTIEAPYDDLGVGLRAALESLEAATARRFADRTRIIIPQEDNGDGTDAFLSTVAATPPLRVGILATEGGGILNALLSIARRSPVTVLPTLTVEPTRRSMKRQPRPSPPSRACNRICCSSSPPSDAALRATPAPRPGDGDRQHQPAAATPNSRPRSW